MYNSGLCYLKRKSNQYQTKPIVEKKLENQKKSKDCRPPLQSLLHFLVVGIVMIEWRVRWGIGGGMPTGQQLAWLTWQTCWVHIVYITAAEEELRQGIALSLSDKSNGTVPLIVHLKLYGWVRSRAGMHTAISVIKTTVFALSISFYLEYFLDNLGAILDRSPILSVTLYIINANYYQWIIFY